MILWMSNETDMGIDSDNLRKIRNNIEKQTNTYLKEISYTNPEIEKIRIVFILRDDDFSVMAGKQGVVRKSRGELAYGINMRLDYNRFKNGDDNTRKKMIYEGILETMHLLQAKKIKNLESVEKYIRDQMEALA
jgi:hypothetical protein